MKTYIGTKIIQAEPMDRRTFHDTIRPFSGWPEDAPTEAGYMVTDSDGYVSWSLLAVFENSFREVTLEEKSLLLAE